MFEDTKPWWQSKTMWGGLIAVVAGIAGVFGFTLGPDDQDLLAVSLTAVAGAVGGIIAIIGRLTAKTDLTVTKQ